MEDRKVENMLSRARKYNESLLRSGRQPGQVPDEDSMETYNKLLDVYGGGIMGYIRIPAISVFLPIYHGTDENVLQVGAGHLASSSLPVGGEGTHCVITGHSGLRSAVLFTDLDQLEEGDTFTITILKEVLTYEVDQIRTVEPDDMNLLAIERGKDYCTLVTCTPYGQNTHRLLVRGHRIETKEEAAEEIRKEASEVEDPPIIQAVIIVAIFVICAALVSLKRRKKHLRTGR